MGVGVTVAKLLKPVHRRLSLLVTRAVGSMVDPSALMQALQFKAFPGEALDGIEHFEPYGLTAHPVPGFEAIIVSLGGDRGHAVCLVASDRRHRVKNLREGEVCLYTDEGDLIHLKRNGNIHIKAAAKITFESPLCEMTGALKVQGDITSSANVSDVTGSLQAVRVVYNGHGHVETGGTTESPVDQM